MFKRRWVRCCLGIALITLIAGGFAAVLVAPSDQITRARVARIHRGMTEDEVEATLGKGEPFNLVGWRKAADGRLVYWPCENRLFVVEFNGEAKVIKKGMVAGLMGPPVKDEYNILDRLRALFVR